MIPGECVEGNGMRSSTRVMLKPGPRRVLGGVVYASCHWPRSPDDEGVQNFTEVITMDVCSGE